MKIQVKSGDPLREKTDALVVGLFEEERPLPPLVEAIDRALQRGITDLLKAKTFKGGSGEAAVLTTQGRLPAKRVILVGLGKKDQFTIDRLRQAAGKAATTARGTGARQVASALPVLSQIDRFLPERVRAVAEGTLLALYRYLRYKTNEEAGKADVKELTLLAPPRTALPPLRRAAREGEILANAVAFARDLVSTPSSDLTPTDLAETARSLARGVRGMRVKVLDRRQMERLKMGGMLGVSRGSAQPPRFIVLEYRPAGAKGKPIALVGKSVTFDSGGISIKPSAGMEQMKYDMSGGAAVLGTMKAAAALKLPVRLLGILPAVENMPSGTAYKPGDILRAMSGRTIEVVNTDAEGRLILADGLHYATRYRPRAIIDLATLTGACAVAVGNYAIAVLGTDEKLIDRVRKAGEASGERVWPLPLWEEYDPLIKSDVADCKNTGDKTAGTIVGAVFLKPFVGKHPWVHLDIASTAWVENERPYIPKGGSGVGIRLLIELLKGWEENG